MPQASLHKVSLQGKVAVCLGLQPGPLLDGKRGVGAPHTQHRTAQGVEEVQPGGDAWTVWMQRGGEGMGAAVRGGGERRRAL